MALPIVVTTVFSKLFFLAIGIAGVGFLIAFHELGHFLFCKLFGINTPSFSIGFGPRLITKKIGDTVFALSAIPLGGYVEVEGMVEVGQGEQATASSKNKHSFAVKPYYQKMLVIAGGIIFNLVFAYVTLIALFSVGIPQTPLLYPKNAIPVVKTVVETSPAAEAGFMPADVLMSLNSEQIGRMDEFLKTIQAMPETSAVITFDREGSVYAQEVMIGSKDSFGKKVGYLGIEFELKDLPARSLKEAIAEGVATANQLICNTFSLFKRLFVFKGDSSRWQGVGGPLMVISQTIQGAQKGCKIFLLLLAFISINLAVLNVLPLPILDGGQAVFYTIEAIIGRPLPEKARLYIHYACWGLMLILVAVLTLKDLRTIIGFSIFG